MANKTIPELNEIDLEDLDDEQLFILDAGTETFKVRMSTLLSYAFNSLRKAIEVTFDGVETGEKTVDVTAYVPDAQLVQWMLKKPSGSPTYAEQVSPVEARIWATDASTVIIDTGDFAFDAGDYTLIGV